jgi:hypothetical protein
LVDSNWKFCRTFQQFVHGKREIIVADFGEVALLL